MDDVKPKRRRKPKFHDVNDRLIMDISWPEAKTLYVLLMKIGGCPVRSPLKYVEGLIQALENCCPGLRKHGQWSKDWAVITNDGFYFRQGDIALNWEPDKPLKI